tara:strand:+ start:86 stop:919 length:834 start_codon:yes stop_codon:yes gene_type:complete
MKKLFLLFSLIFLLSSCHNSSTNSNLRLYVFDCGSIKFQDISSFGLSNNTTPVRELFVPCYLIEHKKGRLLWDAGLPLDVVGKGIIPVRPGIEQMYKVSLLEQLQNIAVQPDEVDFIAMSHMHSDHVGAAERFTQATLLIQKQEFEAAFKNVSNFPVFDISNYQELENNKRVTLTGDFDVFGDGSVIIVSAPGHTPGHQVLLLKLKSYGPILLSGDLYHFVKSRELQAIPTFNTDAEQTIQAMKKVEKIINTERATLWIEHDLELAKSLNLAPAYYD